MTELDRIQSRTIEWLRFPLAVAVVIIHTGCWGEAKDYFSTVLFSQAICRIAVPCFFFFSGFLFYKGLEEWDLSKWRHKMQRRVHSLLIPYLVWNLLGALLLIGYEDLIRIAHSLPCLELRSIISEWKGLPGILLDTGDGFPIDFPLWFIRDLIFMTALTPLIFLLIKKLSKAFIPVVLCLFLVFGRQPEGTLLCHIPEGLAFYSLGAYMSIRHLNFIEVFSKFRKASYVAFLPLAVLTALFFRGNPGLYRISSCIFVIVGVVAVINMVSNLIGKERLKVNSFLAGSSFFVFASHGILIYNRISVSIVDRIIPVHSTVSSGIKVYAEALLTVVICIILFYVIGKVSRKFLGILNGNRA